MAQLEPSDLLVVQRPSGPTAGTYKTPFSSVSAAIKPTLQSVCERGSSSDLTIRVGEKGQEEIELDAGTGEIRGVFIDGGIYAISIDGVVDDIALSANGTGYPGGTQENIATTGGNGNGLTISYRRSLDIVTPGTLHVYSPGEGYEAGDVVTVVGGNGDMQIEILHVISTS